MDTQINLAPQDPFTNSLLGKFITWAVSIGRYIVVVTELIVISAFLSRFYLDKKLSGINNSIEQQVTIIESYSDFETKFRLTQNHLSLTSSLISSQIPTQSFLSDIETLVPPTVYLEQINFQNSQITLKGTALSKTGFIQLFRNLKSHPHLTQVNLGQLSLQSDQNAGIKFQATANWLPPSPQTKILN